MRVGDLLEWLAGVAFIAAAFFAAQADWSVAAPTIVGGVFLAYQAQCHAQQAIPKPRIQWSWRARP